MNRLGDGTGLAPYSMRDRVRDGVAKLGPTLLRDFDAIMAWEDEMLAASNELARRLDAILDKVEDANKRVRHPIDLNYVALLKDDWESLIGLVSRRRG